MILRRGAGVTATDGPIGTLIDLVVDPISDEITDLVVLPDGRYQQPRLVPLWLTTECSDGIRVELDSRHVKQLRRCLDSDFVRSTAHVDRSDHDVRFSSVLCHPFFVDPEKAPLEDLPQDRIARDVFDMRCGLEVLSCNDRVLGPIVGFLVDDGGVHSMVVRSGLPGFRHDVAVPISAIAEVIADLVVIDLDRHEFRQLPTTRVVAGERRHLRGRR